MPVIEPKQQPLHALDSSDKSAMRQQLHFQKPNVTVVRGTPYEVYGMGKILKGVLGESFNLRKGQNDVA